MSNKKIPVIKFLFKEEFKPLKEALSFKPEAVVENFLEFNQLSKFLSSQPAGLILTSLRDKNDLVQIATFMKVGKKVAKNSVIKIVVFNFSKNRNFERAMEKLGILDIVDPSINNKALKFKIDFWTKSLLGQLKDSENMSSTKLKQLNDNKRSEEDKKITPTWTGPLDLEDDIWILKSTNDCKRVFSKWLVRFMGPSPYVSHWTELKKGLWRFDIKESEKQLFLPNEGAWFYTGDYKPDFIWRENHWIMTGNSFHLYFKNAQEEFTRVVSKNHELTIAKNSLYAKTKESIIIESFDKEIVFKKDGENLGNLEGEGGTSNLGSGKLQGKNSGTETDEGPLSGKSSTDEIDGGPLAGKTKKGVDSFDDLYGKSKAESPINHENLEQEASKTKEKSHLSGKSTSDKVNGGPLAGKTKKGVDSFDDLYGQSKAESPINHKNLEQEASKTKEKSHWGGEIDSENEISSDDFDVEAQKHREGDLLDQEVTNSKHKSFYEGHNEAEQYGEADLGGKSGGKSSTDHLKTHYDSSGQKENDPTHSPEVDLYGKSSTAKLDKHYGGAPESKAGAQNTKEHPVDSNGKHPHSSTTKNTFAENGPGQNEEFKKKAQPEAISTPPKYPEDLADKKSDLTDKSTKNRPLESQQETDNVVPLDKKRQEKLKTNQSEEEELETLAADAKVSCYLLHKEMRIPAKLDDFFDDVVTIHTKNTKITSSDNVSIDLSFKLLGKNTQIKIDGSVSAIDPDDEDANYITVKLDRSNVSSLQNFMQRYESRQQNVTEFLKRTKGL